MLRRADNPLQDSGYLQNFVSCFMHTGVRRVGNKKTAGMVYIINPSWM